MPSGKPRRPCSEWRCNAIAHLRVDVRVDPDQDLDPLVGGLGSRRDVAQIELGVHVHQDPVLCCQLKLPWQLSVPVQDRPVQPRNPQSEPPVMQRGSCWVHVTRSHHTRRCLQQLSSRPMSCTCHEAYCFPSSADGHTDAGQMLTRDSPQSAREGSCVITA